MSFFSAEVWNDWFQITAMISGFAMAFIAYTIFFHEGLRVHPAQLVGIFSLAVSICIFNLLSAYLICPGNAEVLFAQTVYFDTSQESLLRAMNTLTYSFLANYVFMFSLPGWIEMCLIHDMVKTLTNPMARSDARANYYYIFVFIMQIIAVTVYACSDF